jgi:hypothetical protein
MTTVIKNQMKEQRKALVEFLKNGKAEIEADGLIPTIDELIFRTDDSAVENDDYEHDHKDEKCNCQPAIDGE